MRVALLLALVLAAAACGGQAQTEAEMPTPTAAVPSDPGAARVAGTTLDGEQISLDDFRGKPVLVNVWSSW